MSAFTNVCPNSTVILQFNKGNKINLCSSPDSSDRSQQGVPVKNKRTRSKHTRSQRDMDAAVIMTSLKTFSPKSNDGLEQVDNHLYLDERSNLSQGNDDDDSCRRAIDDIVADLTEDENEQWVKRTSISKREKQRRPVEEDKQLDESPVHLTRQKAKASGIILDKEGNKRRKKLTENIWL